MRPATSPPRGPTNGSDHVRRPPPGHATDGAAPGAPSTGRDPVVPPGGGRRRPGMMTLLRWAVALIFLGAGAAKLVGIPSTVALFEAVGFGQWFRIGVGSVEVVGAALLASPLTALPAAVGLSLLMVGAAGTEVVVLHRPPVLSGAMLLALLMVAWHER